MALLRDVPTVLRTVGPWKFSVKLWTEIEEDNLFVWASALAYSWLFALFPFLIFLLTLMPYLPDRTKGSMGVELHHAVFAVVPREAAETVWTNVKGIMTHLYRPRAGILSVGLLVALWAASNGVHVTMSALSKCYDLPASRLFFLSRLGALGLTVAVAVLTLVLLALAAVGSVVIEWLKQRNPEQFSGRLVSTWSLSIVLMFLAMALTYYFCTAVRQTFHLLTPGSVFSITVWGCLAKLIHYYLARFGSYDKTYGTIGGVALLLFVFYVDALVLLVGAEINAEIDFACGIERGTRDFRRKARKARART